MEYIIENPSQAYGVDFIRRMHDRFGARAVCFYTHANLIPHSARLQPELFSKDYVAANYCVPPNALPGFIEHLRRHHSISAVIPHYEMTVTRAVALAEGLALDWSQPAVMRRFRDKFSLKAHLRATDPGLRINLAQLVNSPAEALDVVRRNQLARFVLKPNDGVGNKSVGVFSADDPASVVEDYWRRTGAGTVLLEEFIGGREYFCNGQVDTAGNITIIDISRSYCAETDQGSVIRLRNDQTSSGSPEFAPIADYTRRMITASGLRRSPFHAELRVDDAGPCLLECAARLVGGMWAGYSSQMHGPQFDMVDFAAHYYGSSASYGSIGLDWKNYDASMIMKVRGVSRTAEKIRQLQGIRETERLPQFVAWSEKPTAGQQLVVTSTLMSSPYAVMTRCGTLAEGDEVERTIRGLIRWNTRPLSPLERVSYYAGRAPGFMRWKLNRYRKTKHQPMDGVFV